MKIKERSVIVSGIYVPQLSGVRAVTVVFLCMFLYMYAHGQKQGHELADSLSRKIETEHEDSVKVTMLVQLSLLYKTFNPSAGIKCGKEALELANAINWKKGVIISCGALAANYSSRSDDVNALYYLFKQLNLAEELNESKNIASILSNIGVIYQNEQNHKKALEYYLKGLKILEPTGDKLRLAISNGNIGTVYFYRKEYTRALEYNKRALKLSTEIDDKIGIATYIQVIADVYDAEKKYPTAIEFELKALRLSEELGDSSYIATCLGFMGIFYLNMSQDMSVNYKPDSIVPGSRREMVMRATKCLEQSVSMCKNIGVLVGVSEFSKHLSHAYELTGKYKESLATYKEYETIKDSISSHESKVAITNLETRRELDIKEKQLELDRLAVLKKRNERGFFIAGIGLLVIIIANVFRNFRIQKGLNKLLSIEKQKVEERSEELKYTNDELNTTLNELKETQNQLIVTEKQKENELIRSRISQDIHDDISSELTKISWISALAKAKAKKEDIGEVTTLLEKISGYSQDTVSKLGEIIWTVNPKNDSLGSLLSYMRNYVAKFLTDTPFEYTINFPDSHPQIIINPELKRNLFLVLKEALNNAVKYSKATNIEVSFTLQNERYEFAVKDNGVGIDKDVILGGGNGMDNMRKRMEAVKGYIEITSAPGTGTRIVLSGTLY